MDEKKKNVELGFDNAVVDESRFSALLSLQDYRFYHVVEKKDD